MVLASNFSVVVGEVFNVEGFVVVKSILSGPGSACS
jgi:hypothetical protein